MSIASAASRSSRCPSTVTPATRSSTPAAASTGSDCRTMRLASTRGERHAATRTTTAAAPRPPPSTSVNPEWPARPAARTRAGTVARSPRVDTSGARTLSRSQPKRTDPAARARVTAPTRIEASSPPRVDTTTKSARVIVGARPNTMAVPLAIRPRAALSTTLRAAAPTRFCPTTPSGRAESRKVPACTAVPRRLPMAPNTLPRNAMAPGTRRRRPGSSANVPSEAARTMPPADAASTPMESAPIRSRTSAEGTAAWKRWAERIAPLCWTAAPSTGSFPATPAAGDHSGRRPVPASAGLNGSPGNGPVVGPRGEQGAPPPR